jgi:hypothetical protein
MFSELTQMAMQDEVLRFLILASLGLFTVFLGICCGIVSLRVKNTLRGRHRTRLEDIWTPRVYDVLAGEAPPQPFSATVAPSDQIFFLDFLSRFTRLLKGHDATMVRKIAAPHLQVLDPELTHRVPERRARAVEVLGGLAGKNLEQRVADMLRDRSPIVAINAAYALARRGAVWHLHDVVGSLDRFDLWNIPFLSTLVGRMGPAAAPTLRAVLADRSHPTRVRAIVAGALVDLKDLESVGAAEKILREEDDPDLLIAALRLLRKLGGADAVPSARKHCRAANPAVRGHAIRALSRLGGPAEAHLLEEALEDDTPWVVMYAAQGLRGMGRTDILERLARSGAPEAQAAREAILVAPA